MALLTAVHENVEKGQDLKYGPRATGTDTLEEYGWKLACLSEDQFGLQNVLRALSMSMHFELAIPFIPVF